METTILNKRLPGLSDNRFLLANSNSPAIHAVAQMVAKLAPTRIPLLLIGESGTGKEILAQQIHQLSQMAGRPLVKVICALVTSDPLAAHFDGRHNGSGAGTLFLKEISELEATSQRTLLYSLPQENGTVAGGITAPRLISSTIRNLEDEVRAGRFRADLYYQISAASVFLPPLRQRREDIPAFVELFLAKYSALLDRPRPHLDSEDFAVLQEFAWPGNIRELENIVRKIVVIGDPAAVLSQLVVQANETPAGTTAGRTSPLKAAARAASHRTERQLILETLAKTRWNRKRAAQQLQISYKSLLYKLKQIRAEEQEPI